MFFVKEAEGCRMTQEPQPGWMFELRPPVIECNGEETAMTVEEGARFRGAGFLASEQIQELGDGLFAVERKLANNGVGIRRF